MLKTGDTAGYLDITHIRRRRAADVRALWVCETFRPGFREGADPVPAATT